jgi:ArsR family transcriptional regulator
MYRLPLPDGGFDAVVMQMVLHYAEDPPAALAEAARVLRPGGRLVVVDLGEHESRDCLERLAHRWAGFSDTRMQELLTGAGLVVGEMQSIDGPLQVRIWPSVRTVRPTEARARVLEAAP